MFQKTADREERTMANYLEGWKNLHEVQIPPVEHPGFKEDIIIRKRVEPIEPAAPVMQEVYTGEDPTSVRREVDVYTGEDPTVLLDQPQTCHAYIRRMGESTDCEILKSPFVIGKSADCDYVIRDNTTVSRHHAQILTTEEGYMLQDLGSLNYTYIEQNKITGPEKLTDGMIFQLSDVEFQFIVEMK